MPLSLRLATAPPERQVQDGGAIARVVTKWNVVRKRVSRKCAKARRCKARPGNLPEWLGSAWKSLFSLACPKGWLNFKQPKSAIDNVVGLTQCVT